MYLWRRLATQRWWSDNENRLRAITGNGLAIIEKANRKQLELETACRSRTLARMLAREFGGTVNQLPKDWLQRLVGQKTKPLRVGNGQLIIPSGAAFGTGEHATTAMCLRMLERVITVWGPYAPRVLAIAPPRSLTLPHKALRQGAEKSRRGRLRSPDLVVDLGTGSGILALAARKFGAKRAVGFDNDPLAISTAKANARLNRIENIQFRVGDVRRWKARGKIDIVTANLFSGLLIEILPRLKVARWLILSGILRGQEPDVRHDLKRNKIDVVRLQRRGKWVAILAASR
jgi:ribosomal protein L11 methyltransferase